LAIGTFLAGPVRHQRSLKTSRVARGREELCLICVSPESYDEPEILPSSSHPVCLGNADAVQAATYDGRRIRLTTRTDEFTRKCLAIRGGSPDQRHGRHRDAGRRHALRRSTCLHQVGQWPGNGRQGPAPAAVGAWRDELVYRALAHPGRTATASVSLAYCEMNA